MANNFNSNFTNKLMRSFLGAFESNRVLSKSVNTQLLKNAFNPSTGDTVMFKRPTDYTSYRDPTGDLTSSTASDIIAGQASAVVQDYITVHVDYDEADEAIKMDQLDELLAPMAQRIVTDLELDFASYMLKNAGLLAGTYGTAVTTWSDVAQASAVMKAHGIPMDNTWAFVMNPYTEVALADVQRSLGSGGKSGDLIKSAHERAMIADNFAGMQVLTASTLASLTTGSESDRAGAVNGTMDVSYVTHKDSFKQTITVDAVGAGSTVIKAGEVVQITGRNRLNLNTREAVINAAGANVVYTGVVTADVTLSSGAGSVVIAGPAIYEAAGAYNTVDAAVADNDVVTFLGSASTIYQPNMFFHRNAFGIGSVPIKKLQSTDTLGLTKDGLQLRCSKGSNFTKNSQQVRFDLRPAFSTLNPFWAGQGWG